MVCGAAGACDVIQDRRHLGYHLGFYPNLVILKKRGKLKLFDDGHVEYDVIKHFAAFCQHFVLFPLKKGKKIRIFLQKWLEHLPLITSYLAT